jgi:hypothetical protein
VDSKGVPHSVASSSANSSGEDLGPSNEEGSCLGSAVSSRKSSNPRLQCQRPNLQRVGQFTSKIRECEWQARVVAYAVKIIQDGQDF